MDTRTGRNAPMADQYPALAPTVQLHLTPKHGLLSRSTALGRDSRLVDEWTKSLLLECDGETTLRTVIDRQHERLGSHQRKLYGALIQFTEIIREGYVSLADRPRFEPPAVRGDLHTYYPLNLQVELTAECNLRCFYCYRESGPAVTEDRLTTGQLLAILADLGARGLQSVELTGGEPTLHPDFLEILDFCSREFSLIALLTNGTRMTPEVVAALRPVRNNSVVSMSLDSHLASVHDKRRAQRGAFAATTRAIAELSAQGFLTRVSMVVDESNWEHVEPTMDLARRLGARSFAYTPLLPVGRGSRAFRRWSRDPERVLEQELRLRERHPDFLQVLTEESVFDLESPGGCGAAVRTFAMDPSGTVRPCVTFATGAGVLGSLRHQSPEEVFASPLASAFAGLTPPDFATCGSCCYRVFCKGCALRGLIASTWLEAEPCSWLEQPAASHWKALVDAPR